MGTSFEAVWVDCCDHSRKPDRFLGTVVATDGNTYDVYVYQDNSLASRKPDMHLCLRYGSQPGNYISPGNVDAWLERAEKNGSAAYLAALPLVRAWKASR